MIEPGDSEPEVGEVGRLLVVYYGDYASQVRQAIFKTISFGSWKAFVSSPALI